MTIRSLAVFGALAMLVSSSLVLLASASIAQAQAPSRAQRLDAVVALVGGEAMVEGVDVILESQVDFRARIHWAARDRQAALDRTRPVASALLRSTFEELLAEVLIAREAQRVQTRVPSSVEVTVVLRKLEDEAGGSESFAALCRALGVSAAEVEAIAQRRALVDAFLRANLVGTTNISDAEVERVFRSDEHPFVGQDFDAARGALRSWIAQRTLERTLTRWVTVLRARVPVRLLRPAPSE